MLTKLIFNLVLVPNPAFGVNGAAIGSVACHMVAFAIAFTVLRKNIKLDLTVGKFVIRPLLATIIMGVCSYFLYSKLLVSGIIVGKWATILSLLFAVIIYVLAVVALKILNKEEILMLPFGNKIYKVLEKLGVYRKETT